MEGGCGTSSLSRRGGACVTQHQYDDLSSEELNSAALTPSRAYRLAQLRITRLTGQSTLSIRSIPERSEIFLRDISQAVGLGVTNGLSV